MSNRLANKNIIVTAAGQGIGKATAFAFHNEGANVTATDLNEKTLKELNKEFPKINTHTLDSTDIGAIKTFAKSINKVDVLFNAVGFVHHGTILDCEEKDWDFSFNVNIKSMYFMCKAILPKMLDQNKGSIINIASIASSIKGLPNRFVYGASKAAIIGLTKSIAADFVKQNIRCNAIAPGTVFTPSWEDRVKQNKDPVQAKKDFIARQPMGRLGTAEEIAAMAIYLASDESTFTTGNTFSVDGGMTI
jgi:NAD(P)-dependent dehydrogenase (short-subunit alcohol dehydrogenase family)